MNMFNFFLALGWFFLTIALFSGLSRERVHFGISVISAVIALVCFVIDVFISAGLLTG